MLSDEKFHQNQETTEDMLIDYNTVLFLNIGNS
jgi:hypothetical protein